MDTDTGVVKKKIKRANMYSGLDGGYGKRNILLHIWALNRRNEGKIMIQKRCTTDTYVCIDVDTYNSNV